MVHYLTRRQCREIDRIAVEDYGVPSIVLMENAAEGVRAYVTEVLRRRVGQDRVTVLCGKGNNGGDGLAVARKMCETPHQNVRVLLTDPPESFAGDAAVQLKIVQKMSISIESADAFLRDSAPIDGLLVDAVYGTGFRPPSRIDFRPINARVRRGNAFVVSIDVPSGLDTDTGDVIDGNAVVADTTVSMMTYKAAFNVPSAERYHGRIWTVNLGIPWEIVMMAAESPR